ncbi:BamA/TamA family outer membrane protein [Flavisolibacter tropicus]|uniref:Bacterial surface antigen (D15) domain-containing protein n=1 Tax=Flavisolibacter tropicus TaxID=1492898 RepID=A0A172TQV5_9BACT|nr:BamA/TamA family outer membrane protein [Flavisolibacter tropicus]ANE49187.1 hypothetical protein SY85_00385 [Flavisolibacter tropicus]
MKRTYKWLCNYCLTLVTLSGYCQSTNSNISDSNYRAVTPGAQYNRSSFHQWLWGKHYRKEWATPARFPLFFLDTANGGLIPYEAGGSRQSKTIRLKTATEKEYVLRSVDKSFGRALPPIFQNTFVENVLNDQVSTAHPYSASVVAPLAEAARIYHTWPRFIYLPQQQALDTFNKDFGNDLYLFEQRPDGNWEEATNFGNSKEIISTDKLFSILKEDPYARVDQPAFVRARLFDMLVGDWGRHEDQWRWARFDSGKYSLYRPIPRDRDQTFTKFDGVLLKITLSAASLGHLQTFDYKIKDIETYNFPARNLDRYLLNEVPPSQWMTIAKELQQAITDSIIDAAVQELPKEVYVTSGPEISAKLKARRNDIVQYAQKYYSFLAKEVAVVGTITSDRFVLQQLAPGQTSVAIYKISKEGLADTIPYYKRVISTDETKEFRIYGLEGNDTYQVIGDLKKAPTIRIIAGKDRDTLIQTGNISKKKAIQFYDDNGNTIKNQPAIHFHTFTDTVRYRFHYDGFHYDKKSIKPIIFYNNQDRFFVGVQYGITHHKWQREPYAHRHTFDIHYSLGDLAPSISYKGIIPQFVGKWNVLLNASYDWIHVVNFFGIGNETTKDVNDRDYYRMRLREGTLGAGLYRPLGKYWNFLFASAYQTIEIKNDPERYIADHYGAVDKDTYDLERYGQLKLQLDYANVNDIILPTKGFLLTASSAYTRNLQNGDNSIFRHSGKINFYLSFGPHLVLAERLEGATVTGTPVFYQLNYIGGSPLLRGFRRERFWGKTSFTNANELQWIFNTRNRVFNGKAGIIAFMDQGRVWNPNESSDVWHMGYGGGFLISPFDKLTAVVTYGISKEDQLFHIRFSRLLR